jgi:hypothetical protein
MEYTIEKMKHNLEYTEGHSVISINGYAFIDECGYTIIIVYGEGKRDDMSKYLSSTDNKLRLKYKYIKL